MAEKPSTANFFPDVPDFPSMGAFQPVYGKFDLTTYIQGASDYEIMAFLVGKYNACLEAYGTVTKLSTDTVTACKQLQDWINAWFDNLDVQEELNNKIDSMVKDGSFESLLHQTFDEQVDEKTTSAVTKWLVENVDPKGSAVVVDNSLSIKGAAADAKVCGTKLFNKLLDVVPDGTNLDNFTNYGSSFLSSSYTYVNAPCQAGLLLNWDLSDSYAYRKVQIVFDTVNNIEYRRVFIYNKGFTKWVSDSPKVMFNKTSEKSYKFTTNGYTIDFNHIINDSNNADLWNITKISKNGNILVPNGTDILGPIKEHGASSYSGGVHGYEKVKTLNVINTNESVSISMISTIYSTLTNDGIFERTLSIVISNGEITVDSLYKAIKNCSIDRCTNGGLIATYIKDTPNVVFGTLVGPPAYVSPNNYTTTAVFNTNSGNIVMENIIGHELDGYKAELITYTSESTPRCKAYFNTVYNNTNFNVNDTIHGKFKYKLL